MLAKTIKLLLSAFIFAHSTQLAAKSIPAQLEALVNSIQSMQADFQQTVKQGDKVVSKTRGRMAMQKPGHFYWQTDPPYSQVIYISNKIMWVYEPDLKQATMKAVGDDAATTPAALLSGYDKRLTTYYKMNTIEGENNTIGYQLTAANKNASLRYIYLRFQGDKLLQMYIKDQLDQSMEINFSHLRVNQPVDKALFQFVPPAGTDVVQG